MVSLCKHLWVELGENKGIVFCDACGEVQIGEPANA